MEERIGEKYVKQTKNGIGGKTWIKMRKMTECARNAVMLDREIFEYAEIFY